MFRQFAACRTRQADLELNVAPCRATIDAGISARGRNGEPPQVMRPTPGVVGALHRVRKTAMGHAQQGATIPLDEVDPIKLDPGGTSSLPSQPKL